MPEYHVTGIIHASYAGGTIEAENEEEAERKAAEKADISLCARCGDRIQDPYIEEIIVEEVSTND